ncbi:MAG: hypothetical protein PHC62_11125 [Candidatus Izemoplasmatales bacterium]|nr:hypothetical protein [Candidatus Izemoplasmatales bacterium]
MININEEQKKKLFDNLPNAEKLIQLPINDFLIALNLHMLKVGFDKNDEPNEKGYELETLYDEIFSQN